MKFAEHLSAHITPEWRKQYINYENMKVMLYSAVEQLPTEQDLGDCFVEQFDEQFLSYCSQELSKINTFFAEKLAEAVRKLGDLKSELNISEHHNQKDNQKYDKIFRFISGKQLDETNDSKVIRKLNDLKLAFSEFYLSLILLQNYQNLNFTGFRKILKKHDKLMNTNTGIQWRLESVEVSQFYTSKEVDKLIVETENLFTTHLECGDRQKAMKRLRVPPLNAHQSVWTTFRVGLFLGAFLILISNVILVALLKQTNIDWSIMCRLFRGPLFIIIFLFLIGINVYGWRTSGVNHVLIFELDPRDHLSEQHLFEIASIFAVFWSLSVLLYLFSPQIEMNANLFPLLLVFAMFIFLVNPTHTLRHNARFWLLKVLTRVVRAPFVKVNFADFWLADQLNSLVPILLDFEYLICYYLSLYSNHDQNVSSDSCVFSTTTDLVLRTLVACLPAWFRFAQCLRRYNDDSRGVFPHLINAGKYSTTFFVVIFSTFTKLTISKYDNSFSNPFFICWITSMIVSSCYTYIWDIKMDWGLFDAKSPSKDYPFLREEIVYSSPHYYYFAIIEDLILRFGWTLSVSLTEIGVIHADIVVSILAPLEIFRRFVWNFFRLENEHLNNCGEFRAVRDISIAPVDTRDQSVDEQMVSNNVVKQKKPKKLLSKKSLNGSTYLSVKPSHSSQTLRNKQSIQSSSTNNCEVSLLIDEKCEMNRL